jgi:hypothetical protein
MTRGLQQEMAALQPGDHVCVVFDSAAEQKALVAAFLQDGILRQYRCVCILDDSAGEGLVHAIATMAMGADGESDSVLVVNPAEAFLRSGRLEFDVVAGFMETQSMLRSPSTPRPFSAIPSVRTSTTNPRRYPAKRGRNPRC